MKYSIRNNTRPVKKRKSRVKMLLIIFYILLSMALVGACSYFIYDNRKVAENFIIRQVDLLTKNTGFIVKHIYVDGYVILSRNDILSALDIKIGDRILANSPWEVKKKLETNPWIKSAVVDRQLPNDLYIGIRERRPIAIKQYNKKLQLIDEDGEVFDASNIAKFTSLPILIGDGVEYHAVELLDLLRKDNNLFTKIDSVSLIGNRRWDVILTNKIIIKLPERNMKQAWEKFSTMYNNSEIDINTIKVVDLRVERKIFLEKK